MTTWSNPIDSDGSREPIVAIPKPTVVKGKSGLMLAHETAEP